MGSSSIAGKIIAAHLAEGRMAPGEEIAIRIDQTLTQDATGTMAYLEFEAMDVPRVKTELSVSYVDHNTLQTGFENADDHRFLQTAAAKFGVRFSRAGNGICHQVHLERFAAPGKTVLGSDSHTPTAGGIGALAIGAGGLDVAMAMAGFPFHLLMPEVMNVRLRGKLAPWTSAKDVILEVLRMLSVRGGLNKIMEYSGDGVDSLTVPERATIANMGAELGTTTSLFPGDDATHRFLRAQGRERDFVPLSADPDAVYDGALDVRLDRLEPLIALPHSPDNVAPVSEVRGIQVDQVFIGSCTNSSVADLTKVAAILRGKTVAPNVSLVIAPGSRQVLQAIARSGALSDLVAAGARILECACGPCVGVGQSPVSSGVSLRTSNRNFEGRSGTQDAQVYLVGAETAAASAIAGVIADPRELGAPVRSTTPDSLPIDDSMIILPPEDGSDIDIVRGPNIKPLPKARLLPADIRGTVLLKVGDNITTDHIMPAGAKVLPLRSNIPEISKHCFEAVDPSFYNRARSAGGGFIVGGTNYGQGSSREHAALAPLFLGVKAVIAKSFARIHRENLINFGILPLTFRSPEGYDSVEFGHELVLACAAEQILRDVIAVTDMTSGRMIEVEHNLSGRQREVILAGGLLNWAGAGACTIRLAGLPNERGDNSEHHVM